MSESPAVLRGADGRRTLALYDPRVRRRHEDWPLPARLAGAVFSRPWLVETLLRGRAPIEVDGRVLDRGVQLLLVTAEQIEARGGSGTRGPFDAVTMRAELTGLAQKLMPVRTDVYVTGRVIPRGPDAPAIPIRVYRRFGTAFERADGRRGRPPAIVYYHGGGFTVGDLDSHDASCRLLAAVSGCLVVSVEYRLAPEHPFPAAVGDALAAYRWVHGRADELGFEPTVVGVMGDSAGGNLAAVVALEARSGLGDGVPPPVAQVLVYPVTDLQHETETYRSFGEGFFLTRELMEFYRDCYVPEVADYRSPKASPLRAPDHSGLAPALIVTAGFDPLRDDGAKYAEALRSAGTEVEYRCYDDQVHGFMGMGILPVSLSLAIEVFEAAGRMMRGFAAGAE
jgi:acetyl esterase